METKLCLGCNQTLPIDNFLHEAAKRSKKPKNTYTRRCYKCREGWRVRSKKTRDNPNKQKPMWDSRLDQVGTTKPIIPDEISEFELSTYFRPLMREALNEVDKEIELRRRELRKNDG